MLTSLPPQLIQHSFTFCAVPENMAAPLTNVLGPRRMRGSPCCIKSPSTQERTFPVIMGVGTVPIQGTGHHLWYTNTTAYFRRLERVPSLSFKTFVCLFFTSHHICTQTRLNYLSSLGLTAQTTENKYLPADDK